MRGRIWVRQFQLLCSAASEPVFAAFLDLLVPLLSVQKLQAWLPDMFWMLVAFVLAHFRV